MVVTVNIGRSNNPLRSTDLPATRDVFVDATIRKRQR